MSSNLRNKFISVFVSVTTVIWLTGGVLFVPTAEAQTSAIEDLKKQIAELQAKLEALLPKPSPSTTCNFVKSLTTGSKGDDVKCLQQYLNGAGHKIASTGPGSPGGETTYFGTLTKAAVAKWQAANGVSPAVGYFGPISRAKYTSLVSKPPPPPPPPGPPGPPGPPPPAPPGTGLAVAACATQPKEGLHPDNAVRVAYTCMQLTAANDGDVNIDSLTVERQGASTDATFSGVILLDEDMAQVGLEKTLNSNHQAELTEDFTVKAGKTRTMYIAGNRTTGGSNGTKAKFALVKVNAVATITGALPFAGTEHTMNVSGLTIGTASVSTGPSKSVATTTEDAGKTMIFTAIKVEAGSAEDIELRSMRFNQVGTIGKSDITDVQVKVGGTVYPHTISADGKYYIAKFATSSTAGVIITKGNNVEVTIGGTLSGGTNRTIHFDVYRMTDIAVHGRLYGYGINPTASTGFTGTNPVYWASDVTVGKATLQVQADPAVASGNIAINLGDQPLAGFIVDVKGESISVASLVFRVNRAAQAAGATARNADDVDQIKMIDGKGKILAGPTDGSGTTVTFTDTVVFPIGKTNVKLVGKLDTDWVNSETVTASTTPGSNWTTVTGQNTGETIVPTPSSAVAGNAQTVRAAAVEIRVAATPIVQTVVAGVQGFHFTTYELDAGQSGEDVRFISIPLEYNVFSGSADNLTSCQLYDGDKTITTGSNVVNPTARASSTTFTFDGSGLVIPRNTLKILTLKCNIASGVSGSYSWGYDSSSSPSPTGLTSGQSATLTERDSPGQRMTLASSGSYTVVNDSTPGYRVVNSGATGVTLLRLKFAALNEDVDIQRVGFQLTDTASNSVSNLMRNEVVLYDEAAPTVKIGNAVFAALDTGDFATSSSLVGKFIIPKGGAKVLLVKGDVGAIGIGSDMERSGDLLIVDYDGSSTGTNGANYGVGKASGANISPSSADTAVGGVRIFRAFPTFAFIDVSDKKLATGDNLLPLYRFSVKADGGDVHIGKLTFNIASTTISGNTLGTNATTSKYTLRAYTDSGFTLGDTTASGNASGAGIVNGGQCYLSSLGLNPTTWGANGSGLGLQGDGDIEIFPTSTCLNGTTTYKVPAGVTRYFELRANITSVESAASANNSIVVILRGDAAFPTAPQTTGLGSNANGEMRQSGILTTGIPSTTAGVDGDTNDDFIWSPGSTSTTPTSFDLDYTNGYQVPGLPATDMSAQTFTSTN